MPMPKNTRRRKCACRCGRRVTRPRNRYFSRACVHRTIAPALRRARGQEGGKARAVNFQHRLLEQLATLPFRDAVLRAYFIGRRQAYRQKGSAA